jgi:ketosteroid isomerase-like protein
MIGNVPPSPVTATGADHVRMAYHYVDAGDFDAYASLLHDDMQVRGLSSRPAHGRTDATLLARGTRRGHHELYKLIADGDSVVAVGRHQSDGPADVEFADVFTVADNGLLLCQRRFVAAEPTEAE